MRTIEFIVFPKFKNTEDAALEDPLWDQHKVNPGVNLINKMKINQT